VIVGGGTAGFMTATTFVRLFPKKKITLIESPNIKTVGVGESTIVQFRQWLSLVGIEDEDFMKYCDASYKFTIRFTNFNKKNSGRVEYPFSQPESIDDNRLNLWYFKKILHPKTPLTDYTDSFYPIMALVNNNKVFTDKGLGNFNFKTDTAFHFDATKFGIWLRDNICQNITHIKSNVNEIKTNKNGIESLQLDNGDKITGDLFIDCTGFKSLLLEKTLGEEFISYNDIIPNNKAWATHVDYTDKEKQLEGVTNATALKNGWVWNIPLWSKIGTGYVYSDKYTTDEKALKEFQTHLTKQGFNISEHEFNNIKMKIGIHKRLFVKNVVAIGLSAGFIEPLESNGLYTVHEFLHYLTRVFERDNISQWDRDTFNYVCRNTFRNWAEFVSLHYALSERDDTKYWKDNLDREYDTTIHDLKPTQQYGFRELIGRKMYDYRFNEASGISCISAGYGYFPLSDNTLRYGNKVEEFDYTPFLLPIKLLDDRKKEWNDVVKDSPTLYEYLKKEVYNDV
jgi:flavin-dependent dehydrogenase